MKGNSSHFLMAWLLQSSDSHVHWSLDEMSDVMIPGENHKTLGSVFTAVPKSEGLLFRTLRLSAHRLNVISDLE